MNKTIPSHCTFLHLRDVDQGKRRFHFPNITIQPEVQKCLAEEPVGSSEKPCGGTFVQIAPAIELP